MTGVGTGFGEGNVVPFTPAALVSFEGGTEATASGAAEPPTSTVGLAVASTGAAPASAAVGKSVVITGLDFPLSIHVVTPPPRSANASTLRPITTPLPPDFDDVCGGPGGTATPSP